MGGKDRARIAIYTIGGIYLWMISYNMFSNLSSVVTDSEKWLSIFFIIIFVVAGSGMVGLGIWDMYRNYKKMKEEYYSEKTETEVIEEEKKEEEIDEQFIEKINE